MITWINYCSLAVLFTTVYNGGFLERLPFPVYAATATLLTGIHHGCQGNFFAIFTLLESQSY